MPHFHGAGLHRVEHLQGGHDLAGGEGADLELAVGDFRDALGDVLGRAVQRVEALRPARREAPLEAGLGLSDRRRGDGAGGHANCRVLEERSALHEFAPLLVGRGQESVLQPMGISSPSTVGINSLTVG